MKNSVIDRLAGHYQGRWLQGYVRGKLGSDPAFAAIWKYLADNELPLLDVGCGVGLAEFYLREMGYRAPIRAFDFDRKKIQAAESIREVAGYADLDFQVQDVAEPLDFQGNVILLDVLHYLAVEKQRNLLGRIGACVPPGGFCLIRATPRDASWRFAVTRLEEWLLVNCGWMKSGAVHYLEAGEIVAPFESAGFLCEKMPLWGRTPLNSHLFIFRKPVPVTASSGE